MKRIIDLIFLFVGSKIKPISTTLTTIIMLIIAVWGFANDHLFGFLCGLSENFSFLSGLCEIEASKFYSMMLGFIAVLQALSEKLKKVQPQELKLVGVDMPVWGWIMALFVIAFLILVFVFSAPYQVLQVFVVLLILVVLIVLIAKLSQRFKN